MGYKNRTQPEANNSSSLLSEALLFATMCIIGLPVDVYVKDGSVYSGIFYTASVEKDYGIVLKNAKLTKKGKSNAHVANGGVIETLVIVSCDLVQVVAKGVLLPADGVVGNFAGDDVEAFAGTVTSSESQISEAKKPIRSGMNKRRNHKRNLIRNENGYSHAVAPTKAEKEHEGKKLPPNNIRNVAEIELGMNAAKIEGSGDTAHGRQVGDDKSRGEQGACTQTFRHHREENADDVRGSSSNLSVCQAQVNSVVEAHPKMTFKQPNGVSHDLSNAIIKPDNQCNERPTSANTSLDVAYSRVSSASSTVANVITSVSYCSSLAASTEMLPPQSSEYNKSSKEFKLNPEAKIFSPSFINPISANTPSVPVASMAYMPNNSPVVPVAAAHSEVGISPYVPHSSVPAKFVPYGNLTAGNGGSTAQYSQHIVGHIGSRTQPVRYASHYPVQAGPAYVHPNSPAVMVSRLGGQLVYMPVSNDMVQSVAAISPVTARPALTPHHIQYPKHQGNPGQALQLCMPSPLMSNGMQPYAMPSHMPILQPPIPINRPIPVLGSNGLYSSKFP